MRNKYLMVKLTKEEKEKLKKEAKEKNTTISMLVRSKIFK